MKQLHTFTVVIIGAGYAGTAVAGRLLGRAPGKARVIVVDRAPGLTERIRLHQWVAGQTVPPIPYPKLFGKTDVEFRQASVRRIDPDRKTVLVEGDGGTEEIRYDRLVLAAGSVDSRSLVPGACANTHAIATPQAAAALKQKLDRLEAGSEVVICGGGATAIETITEIADARPDLRFTIVSDGPVAHSLSVDGRAHVLRALEARSIRVLEGPRIESVEPDRLVLDDGGFLAFDLAIWAAAFLPGTLARESGFAVKPNGQLHVDPTLRSVSHPDMYGVGDAAYVDAPGEPAIRMACATALPMGAHAADNLARELDGELPSPFRFAYQVQCISLGRRDAVLQFVDPYDAPVDRTVRGRLGAIAKELICRYTVLVLKAELRGIRAITWPKPVVRPEADEGAPATC